MNTAQDGLIVQDEFGRIEWCNPSYCRMTGWSRAEIIGRKPQSFLVPPEDRLSDEEIEAFRFPPDFKYLERYEVIRNIRKNGEIFWNQLNFGAVEKRDGRLKYVIVARDVSHQVEQREALEDARLRLEAIANTDPLTGLANRFRFETALEESLQTHDTGVVNIDLDGFKEVNDGHGHAAGDAVLSYVAAALQGIVGPEDLVARIGGDEFVVLSPDQDREGVDALGQRILADAKDWSLDWHGTPLRVGVSLGAAVETRGTCSADELLRRSDFALYAAKNAGKGRLSFYDLSMHRLHLSARKTLADLRQGIADGAFETLLQPVYCTSDHHVVGFENLLRWRHPSGEIMEPDAFLDLAIQHGLMAELDYLSMRLAIKAKASLAEAGLPHLFCSFNASPEVLSRANYVDVLIWECDAQDVDPAQIIVEVHESTIIGDAQSGTAKNLDRLAEAGFRVALDDFGAGNTGLAKLANLKVQLVKLDRSLMAGLPEDRAGRSVFRALCGLCHDLDLSIVAEGIETAPQLDLATEHGCTMVQGFLLDKPMTLDNAVARARHLQNVNPPRLERNGPNGGN
ncbi:MAG: hypothetical protein Rhims3KO_35850 [Hyphomicrobiales bacterium]